MAADAAEPLITEAEIVALVGPLVRTTPVPGPGDLAMICKGGAGTMSLVVVGGGFAALNATIGRLTGRRLSGIGYEAWLLNKHRTVVARVGPRIVKITVNRRRLVRDPTRLCVIAAAVAGRLAGRLAAQDAAAAADRPADLGVRDTTA